MGKRFDQERDAYTIIQEDFTQRRQEQKPCHHISRHFTTEIIILSILVLANLLGFVANFYTAGSFRRPVPVASSNSYSPADTAISYQDQFVQLHNTNSPFTGPPRPEHEEAWDGLLQHAMIEVTSEELKVINQTSVRLNDNGNYMAYLEVYHQLHCVRIMIQSRHPELYPELVAMGKLSDEHFDHCIETLRNRIMCSGDTQLGTWEWKQHGQAKIAAVHHSGPRKCVDWESLDNWAKSRSILETWEERASEANTTSP